MTACPIFINVSTSGLFASSRRHSLPQMKMQCVSGPSVSRASAIFSCSAAEELRGVLDQEDPLAAEERDGLGGLKDVFRRLGFGVKAVEAQGVRFFPQPMLERLL